jgi:glycosyltransferase involved in cell wall biosynthesis
MGAKEDHLAGVRIHHGRLGASIVNPPGEANVIRVLEVLATLKRAGAETMVASLVCGLNKKHFEPRVVSLYDPFSAGLEPTIADSGVQVHHLGKHKGFDVRMFGRTRRIIQEFQPHLVHTHSYVMRYVLPAAMTSGRPKLVHTVHNLASHEVDGVGRAIHKLAFSLGAVPVAVSEEVAVSFEKLYGFRAAAVIPNGVPTDRLYRPQHREAWRLANGFARDEVLYVSVARLEPQKNPLLLADTFARIPFGQLLLAGEGSLRPKLEGRPGIHLLGTREDTIELLNACDVFVLSSDWEGHPLALIEAMAAGRAVVATKVGGVPGIVGDAGILVPPSDVSALEDALVKVGSDSRLRMQLGDAARQRVQRFDTTAMVSAYEDLFRQVAT